MSTTKSVGTNNGSGVFEASFETCQKNQETAPNTAWDKERPATARIGKAAAEALAAIVKCPSIPRPKQPEPQTSGAVASTESSGFFLNRPITEKERALLFDGPGMLPVSRPGGMFAVGPALPSPARAVQSPAVRIASISLGIGAVAASAAGALNKTSLPSPARAVQSPAVRIASISLGIGAVAASAAESVLTPLPC